MTRDTRAALAAAVAVIAVVILGFRFLGSPGTQRLVQSDLRTVQALSQLAQQIKEKSISSNNEIPSNIDAFPNSAKQNPITHKNFTYRPKSKTEYDLCATFATDSREIQPQLNSEDRWTHPKGDYCFSLDTTAPVPPYPYSY